jgi:hypothetical protein
LTVDGGVRLARLLLGANEAAEARCVDLERTQGAEVLCQNADVIFNVAQAFTLKQLVILDHRVQQFAQAGRLLRRRQAVLRFALVDELGQLGASFSLVNITETLRESAALSKPNSPPVASLVALQMAS